MIKDRQPLGTALDDVKTKWLISEIDDTYNEVYEKVISEMLYGSEEKLMHKVFTQKLSKQLP